MSTAPVGDTPRWPTARPMWSTQVPITVLSGGADAADKVEALDAGADDYVTKPFNMDELLALPHETDHLRFHIAQLRRKLEPDPAHPRHLLTEVGLGYRYQP